MAKVRGGKCKVAHERLVLQYACKRAWHSWHPWDQALCVYMGACACACTSGIDMAVHVYDHQLDSALHKAASRDQASPVSTPKVTSNAPMDSSGHHFRSSLPSSCVGEDLNFGGLRATLLSNARTWLPLPSATVTCKPASSTTTTSSQRPTHQLGKMWSVRASSIDDVGITVQGSYLKSCAR